MEAGCIEVCDNICLPRCVVRRFVVRNEGLNFAATLTRILDPAEPHCKQTEQHRSGPPSSDHGALSFCRELPKGGVRKGWCAPCRLAFGEEWLKKPSSGSY